ncbi:MAG: hypothetical protein Q4C11_00955 [Clostridium sp.]|jgi:hypothetical protein|nr:hypothetical protein [Clostridium sp.]
MFFVLNKKKINSYLLSLGMVAILFTVSVISANNLKTVDTSANILQNTTNEIVANTVQ